MTAPLLWAVLKVLLILFILAFNWYSSLAMQSMFHHRYAAHRMYTFNYPWGEKLFFWLSLFFMGSSYLNPYAYGILHRLHHKYADKPGDPHSPKDYFGRWDGLWLMMWHTKKVYSDISNGVYSIPEAQRESIKANLPEWKKFNWWAESWGIRLLWVGIYIAIYWWIHPFFLCYLFIPIHILSGPIHGALVNWYAHKKGTRSYNTDDTSTNLPNLASDLLVPGEGKHNNHHQFPSRANFAIKTGEHDPYYKILKWLDQIGFITIKNPT